jgi:hypothetical protein
LFNGKRSRCSTAAMLSVVDERISSVEVVEAGVDVVIVVDGVVLDVVVVESGVVVGVVAVCGVVVVDSVVVVCVVVVVD